MRHWIRPLLTAAAAGLLATVAAAESTWVPVAAHLAGANGTRWRTDLNVLNPCEADVPLELRLHTTGGVATAAFVVPAGEQQLFQDVVALLTDEDTKGALEIAAEAEIMVTSRTANHSDAGTFGQVLDSVRFGDGIATGGSTVLLALRESSDYRTNLGVLNTGTVTAAITVELFDRLGAPVGSFALAVSPASSAQVDRPFLDRFGRSDILAGSARITVARGGGISVYASVVDNRTGDATTVIGRPPSGCRPDVAEQLAGIEGLTATEVPSNVPGTRRFELEYRQPEDHDRPDGPWFTQRISLLHASLDAPMVLNTQGYELWTGTTDLQVLLACNQLQVEHRFFGDSVPASGDWSLLTIRQAAADHHRIVAALAPVYGGAWLSTGYSKGGMTATYHRRFYPHDVDATVAFVAPLSLGAPDDRYIDFLAAAGTPSCNQALLDLQRETLGRRDAMVPRIAALPGATFDRIGGVNAAFESIVIELPFVFWQYSGVTSCSQIPPTTADDQTIFDFVDLAGGWIFASDAFFDLYDPYFYQAHAELGFPAVARGHIADLLQTDAVDLEQGLPPVGADPVFDPAAMTDIASWVATEGERLMFVYGEWDPWTGGAYELGDAADSYRFVVPQGTHGAGLARLAPADRQDAVTTIARWAGVTTVKQLEEAPAASRWPPWRRGEPLHRRPSGG